METEIQRKYNKKHFTSGSLVKSIHINTYKDQYFVTEFFRNFDNAPYRFVMCKDLNKYIV